MLGLRVRTELEPVAASVATLAPLPRPGGFAALLDEFTTRRDRLDAGGDRRAAFCRAYALHLEGMRGLIDDAQPGGATDWVERVEIGAARQYVRALDAWDRGELHAVSAPWRAAFAHARVGDASVCEALRAGLQAHLSYDVPLAIARTGVDEHERAAIEAAFAQVTRLLAEDIDSISDAVLVAYAATPAFASDAITCDRIVAVRRRAWSDGLALEATTGTDARAQIFAPHGARGGAIDRGANVTAGRALARAPGREQLAFPHAIAAPSLTGRGSPPRL